MAVRHRLFLGERDEVGAAVQVHRRGVCEPDPRRQPSCCAPNPVGDPGPLPNLPVCFASRGLGPQPSASHTPTGAASVALPQSFPIDPAPPRRRRAFLVPRRSSRRSVHLPSPPLLFPAAALSSRTRAEGTHPLPILSHFAPQNGRGWGYLRRERPRARPSPKSCCAPNPVGRGTNAPLCAAEWDSMGFRSRHRKCLSLATS